MANLENDTVDEEPLFADDLDEYEEQDEEDDPPPLPPPIQGIQSNPLSRLNNIITTIQYKPHLKASLKETRVCLQ